MVTNTVSKKEVIQQLVNNLEKSWNRHDAKTYAQAFAEDGDFTTVFGQVKSGRKTIEEGHAMVFSTVFKNASIIITETKIRFIKPDIASVDTWWEMNGANLWDENVSRKRKGLLNWL